MTTKPDVMVSAESTPKTKRKARVEVINGFFTACVVVVGSFIFFCVFRWILEWAW